MELTIDRMALDALMPMHLQADDEGRILHVGPTLAKTRSVEHFLGKSLFQVFEFRRPRDTTTPEALRNCGFEPLRLSLRDAPRTALRGAIVAAGPGHGVILNLSFGFSVLEAIKQYELHSRDFAATDPTLEMLYLIEAKSAAMDESRDLNLRLQGAKIAAEEQAFTDTLTGLKNRRAMDHVLKRYVEQEVPFTLLGIDLDFFKEVNDSFGHAAGDHVLQRVARILVDSTRPGDTLVRNGGDEFVVVLRDQTDPDVARTIGQRLIRRIEEPIPFERNVCQISASIGVATSDQLLDVSISEMLRDMDAALYHSKHEGRARVSVYQAGMETPPPPDKTARMNARP